MTNKFNLLTSSDSPVFNLYIILSTANVSSVLFIAKRNFGLSGKKQNAMEFVKLTEQMMTMKSRQGTKFTKFKSKLQFIGIMNIPMIAEYRKIAGINVETMAAALGAFSLV